MKRFYKKAAAAAQDAVVGADAVGAAGLHHKRRWRRTLECAAPPQGVGAFQADSGRRTRPTFNFSPATSTAATAVTRALAAAAPRPAPLAALLVLLTWSKVQLLPLGRGPLFQKWKQALSGQPSGLVCF